MYREGDWLTDPLLLLGGSGMDSSGKFLPRISFKGAFTFCLILFIGILLLTRPFQLVGLSNKISYFLSAGISASAGLILVLTKFDAKPEERHLFKKRIMLSIIFGFTASAIMIFVFGGDAIG